MQTYEHSNYYCSEFGTLDSYVINEPGSYSVVKIEYCCLQETFLDY
jgi:hypothetical protein